MKMNRRMEKNRQTVQRNKSWKLLLEIIYNKKSKEHMIFNLRQCVWQSVVRMWSFQLQIKMVKIISSIFLCQVLLKSEIESAIKIEFKTKQLEARICIVNNDYGRVWSKKKSWRFICSLVKCHSEARKNYLFATE